MTLATQNAMKLLRVVVLRSWVRARINEALYGTYMH
jgi:hypothetical protein